MPAPVNYRDGIVRILVAIAATHVSIVYGEPENSFELLLTRDYYLAFAGTFPIALILVQYVYWITRYLDKRYEWVEQPLQRTLLQTLLGLVTPAIADFLLVYSYLNIRGIDIMKTGFLRYDYPFFLMMILLLNGYYLAYYFYLKWAASANDSSQLVAVVPDENVPANGQEVEASRKEFFTVTKGTATVSLPVTTIAHFYRVDEANFLRTFDDETFLVTLSLDDVEQQLDRARFFRVNRQVIIQFTSLQKVRPIAYGKLELILSPGFRSPVIVSQKRAPQFKKWLDYNKYRLTVS